MTDPSSPRLAKSARKAAPAKATGKKATATKVTPTKAAATKVTATKATATKATATKRVNPAHAGAVTASNVPVVRRDGATAVEAVVMPPATRQQRRRIRESVPAPTPGLTLPGLGWTVSLPAPRTMPWLAGLVLVAALDIIDWPVAILLAVGHTIMTNTKNEELRQLAEGIEASL